MHMVYKLKRRRWAGNPLCFLAKRQCHLILAPKQLRVIHRI